MLNLTWKNLLAHKRRLIATFVAILLGVSFMAGSLVLTDTVAKTFDDLFTEVSAGVDGVVQREEAFSNEFAGSQRGTIPASVADQVEGVPEVEAAEGQVFGFAQFIDEDGEALGDPGQGPPTLGFNWSDVPELNSYTLAEGSAPEGPDQVVVDQGVADELALEVGDSVDIQGINGRQTFEVAGIATFGETNSLAGATTALFDLPTAQAFLGYEDTFQEIWMTAAEGVSQEDLVTAVRAAVPQGEDLEVVTGEQYTQDQQDQIRDSLSFFNTFLNVFSMIILVVGAFVIYNAFTIIVAQRQREMALLRAVGAGRGQVLGSLLLEAVAIGLLAAVAGLFGGIVLAEVLKGVLAAVGFEIPSTGAVVQPSTVVASLVVGVGITVVAAVIPAYKASRVPPLAAMRDVSVDRSASSLARILIGLAMLAVGVALLLLGLFGDGGIAMVGIAVALVFFGVIVEGPILAPPLTRVLGAPLARLRGTSGHLARENALRNPKRTAATAAALLIGVGLVGFIAVLAQSIKTTVNESIDRSFQGDLAVSSGSFGFGGLPPELFDEVDAVDGIGAASPIRFGFAQVGFEQEVVLGVSPQLFDIVDVGEIEGDIDAIDQGGIAVSQDVADEFEVGVGDEANVQFAETGSQPFEIVAVFEDEDAIRADLPAGLVLGTEAYAANFPPQQNFDNQLYLTFAEGADPDQVRADVEDVVADYPPAEVQDISELKEAQSSQINGLLSFIYVLLFLAIVIALLGIRNTLSLSIYERTRELGLLRAVGMTRAQLRSTVRWESVIVSLIGTLLGLVLALFFSWTIVEALRDEGITSYDVPIVQLAVITVLGAVAGVVAAVGPARRAAKLDVLDAIGSE